MSYIIIRFNSQDRVEYLLNNGDWTFNVFHSQIMKWKHKEDVVPKTGEVVNLYYL